MNGSASASFRIIGGDGQEYGPIDLATLQQWAREGRVRQGSRVWDSRTGAWQTAAQVPDMAAVFGIAPPPVGSVTAQPFAPTSATNKLAVWSLVCGILGMACCGVFAIAAIPLGMSALGQIRVRGGEGRGLAIAGIVLGIVGLVFGALVLLFVLLAGVVKGLP